MTAPPGVAVGVAATSGDAAAHAHAGTPDADAAEIERSAHEPDRFAAIYDTHFPEIYRYVAARLGRDIADDLAAEVFLIAFRKRHTFDPARGAVRPWLYGIATNLVGQHRRDERRRIDALGRLPGAAGAGEQDGERVEERFADRVAERVTAQALRPRLAGALAALPEGDRDALLLAAVGDLGYEDIARALDIPTGTVGSRLNRARRRLRDAFGGSDPTQVADEPLEKDENQEDGHG